MATEETKVHLLPTDPAQDRILEEFLNKFKHKSAIDHIEKRLKKARSDHVVRLNVMRALITIQRDRLAYFNHVAAKYLGPSITALADIAAQTVTDLACLEAVDESGRGSWIGQYWQKAAELHPDYEDVFDIWFDTQFRKQQYDEAAKAVVSWRKYFPSKAPELSWRLILCYHLATTSPHVGERQKSMCGMLRDKLLEQAVGNTPSRNEKLPTLRCQLDLELVCDIYMSTGKHQRALDILDDDSKGLRSPFGSWALVRLKLDSLLALDKADELRGFAKQIIEDAVNPDDAAHTQHWGFGDAGDDFHVARIMIMFTRPDDHDKILALLESLATTGSLNGHIGVVLYHCKHSSAKAAREALQRFWTIFAPLSKAVDLKLLEHLPREERAPFITYTEAFGVEKNDSPSATSKQMPSVNSVVQSYQLRFLWSAADLENLREAEAVVCELLSLWRLSIQSEAKKPAADNGSGDEAMILAARMCLRLFRTAPERFPNALSHARLILELLLQFSKHNYRALILLIRICLYQGAATKAMLYYRRLDIKNLQFVTEAACMLQSLSVLHPFPVLAGPYNPWGELLKMRQWIAKRFRTYDNFIAENLEEGNWSGVLDQLDTKSKAFQSTSVAIVNMEVCQVAAKTSTAVDQEIVAAAEASLDQIAPFVKPESGTANGQPQTGILDRIGQEFPERIHEVLHLGASVDYSELATRLWDVIFSNEIRLIIRQLPARHNLKHDRNAASHIIRIIWTYISCISNPKSKTADMEAILSHIDAWLESTLSDVPIGPIAEQPSAIHSAAGPVLVRFHGTLDVLRLLDEVLEWARRERPASATHTQGTSNKTKTYQERLRCFAENWMESFDRSEKASTRARSDMDNALVNIMGDDAMLRADKEFLNSVKASVACLAKVASHSP